MQGERCEMRDARWRDEMRGDEMRDARCETRDAKRMMRDAIQLQSPTVSAEYTTSEWPIEVRSAQAVQILFTGPIGGTVRPRSPDSGLQNAWRSSNCAIANFRRTIYLVGKVSVCSSKVKGLRTFFYKKVLVWSEFLIQRNPLHVCGQSGS